MALNLFLLTHKCGNHYVRNVHHSCDVPFVPSVKRNEVKSLVDLDHWDEIINIRCRNFSYKNLVRAGMLDNPEARFLVFTRNPASFVHSATAYHLRGNEEWARETSQPHLGGKSLTQALTQAENEAERQIIIMTQFRKLYVAQASLAKLFNNPNCMRIKIEELFCATAPEYYAGIAKFLRLGSRSGFVDALKKASPAFMTKLPAHSTSAFKILDPYGALTVKAQKHYNDNFAELASILGYELT